MTYIDLSVLSITKLVNTVAFKDVFVDSVCVSQIEKIDEVASNAVGEAQGLGRRANQITKLVQVVKDIADQTSFNFRVNQFHNPNFSEVFGNYEIDSSI